MHWVASIFKWLRNGDIPESGCLAENFFEEWDSLVLNERLMELSNSWLVGYEKEK